MIEDKLKETVGRRPEIRYLAVTLINPDESCLLQKAKAAKKRLLLR
jgi:hypothetical protein